MTLANNPISRCSVAMAFSLALLVIAMVPAHAQTETVLYSFCPQAGCTDGAAPYGGVVFGKKGNLYGTTIGGGANSGGTVFKLTPNGTETVLYSFCSQGCADGASPNNTVIMDKLGNLYGTTNSGGANNGGTVYKVAPNGTETVLYSFCSQGSCVDGRYPQDKLVMDKLGNLYGQTNQGGENGVGTVFKVTPGGTETVLYSFSGPDGSLPGAGLVMDKKGNLYGTTTGGGASDGGTVYKVSPNGTETVLYSFCSQPACADGYYPYAGALVIGKKGVLYGTASAGGANGSGAVFKVTPNGTETTLYNFCSQPGCADGNGPVGGMVMDKKGNLYGTTTGGGANNNGAVFELTPGGTETVLYSFCSPGCGDAQYPYGDLILDKQGNLYGTTIQGGANNEGAVFKVTP